MVCPLAYIGPHLLVKILDLEDIQEFHHLRTKPFHALPNIYPKRNKSDLYFFLKQPLFFFLK